MAIDYSVVKHTRAEIGKSLAQTGGAHLFSLDISGETGGIDNGRFVKVTGMTDLDKYAYGAPGSGDVAGKVILQSPTSGLWLIEITEADPSVAFIYQKPLIYEESPKVLTDEANFYNDPDDGPVRGYGLSRHDAYWLSADGFSGDVAVGKTFTTVTDGKPVLA